MDIVLVGMVALLLLVFAFGLINYKRGLLRRKKAKISEEKKRIKIFRDASDFIEQYNLMDGESSMKQKEKKGFGCYRSCNKG
jgi:hypothetical protein